MDGLVTFFLRQYQQGSYVALLSLCDRLTELGEDDPDMARLGETLARALRYGNQEASVAQVVAELTEKIG